MIFEGARLAVAGMGRSGLAIAKSAIHLGAHVTVYDEHSPDDWETSEEIDKLHGMGASVVTGWHGHLADDFDILVASPGFRRTHPAICDALELGKEVISEIEFAFRIARAPIVAITGTNGKSTTTVLTWMLINAAKRSEGFAANPFRDLDTDPKTLPAILCGNISGTGYPELTLTEAASIAEPDQILVSEVSSYQLEWVKQFRPRVAAITNITPDHLDRHPSFDDYRQTKLRLFRAMGGGDVAVVNESEPSASISVIHQHMRPEVGIRSFATSLAESGKSKPTTYRDGERLVLSGRIVPIEELALRGDHNVCNAMMAWEIAAAVIGGIDDATSNRMIKALATFNGLAHRLEWLGSKGGVQVYNNSMCTNPGAVIASSAALPMRQHLLMGGNTKNLDFEPVNDYLKVSKNEAYLYGHRESANDLTNQLGDFWPIFETLESAFAAATEAAKCGEAIVLSPGCLSSFPFTNFRERGDHFRNIAKEWLAE